MPKKTQRMVYAKGQSVFELIDPDGHIYVLQAHDAQFPIESLAKLGEQMKQLPSPKRKMAILIKLVQPLMFSGCSQILWFHSHVIWF
jgi:hypothetical protein